MTKETLTNSQVMLHSLIDDYETAKAEEAISKKAVEEAFNELIEHPDIVSSLAVKAIGSRKINPRLSIAGKETDKWDQVLLAEIATGVNADGEEVGTGVKAEMFPFTIEYKPVKKELDAIKKMFPDLYKIIMKAHSSKPAKTGVTINELD